MKFRAIVWFASLVFLGTILAAPPAQAPDPASPKGESAPAPPVPGGEPLVATGAAPDLALIYTGGVAGYVEPCG